MMSRVGILDWMLMKLWGGSKYWKIVCWDVLKVVFDDGSYSTFGDIQRTIYTQLEQHCLLPEHHAVTILQPSPACLSTSPFELSTLPFEPTNDVHIVRLSHQDLHDPNHILGSTARRTSTYRILPLCRCLVQIFSRSVTSLASTGWTLHHVGIAASVITIHCNTVCTPCRVSKFTLWESRYEFHCPVISLVSMIATIILPRLLDHPFSACNKRPARPKNGPQ